MGPKKKKKRLQSRINKEKSEIIFMEDDVRH